MNDDGNEKNSSFICCLNNHKLDACGSGDPNDKDMTDGYAEKIGNTQENRFQLRVADLINPKNKKESRAIRKKRKEKSRCTRGISWFRIAT